MQMVSVLRYHTYRKEALQQLTGLPMRTSLQKTLQAFIEGFGGVEAMITVNSQKAFDDLIDLLNTQFEEHHYLIVDVKTGKQRSAKQNAALQVYCRNLAKELNDNGVDFRTFFKPGFQLKFTETIVKENIWRPVQEAMTGKHSTTKPTRQDYIDIYDVINRKVAEYGIYVPFPNKDEED
jgi:hypothetical protein